MPQKVIVGKSESERDGENRSQIHSHKPFCNLPFTIWSDKRFPSDELWPWHIRTDHWIGMRLLSSSRFSKIQSNNIGWNDINHTERTHTHTQFSTTPARLQNWNLFITSNRIHRERGKTALTAAAATTNMILLITISDFVIHLCFAHSSVDLSDLIWTVCWVTPFDGYEIMFTFLFVWVCARMHVYVCVCVITMWTLHCLSYL